jgi:hypothetical protein
MKRLSFLASGVLSLVAVAAAAANDPTPTAANLTATQIVDRNVAARGGLEAWRAINSLTLTGKLEAGGKTNPELPFVMKMKRPHKSRLEIRFKDQTSIQVYDGAAGWKVRPFLNRDEVEPYTPAEAKQAKAWEELDGPLIDYAKKGTKVALIGTEAVEGHNAYKLKLTMKDGQERNVWIDAGTFLERKIDGEPRKVDGKMRNVAVFYRDFKKQGALVVPSVLETRVDAPKQTPHKMRIETIAVNEPMADGLFAKPQLAMTKAAGK